MTSEEDTTSLDTLKDRLPELDVSIEHAATQIQEYTGARRTTVGSALNDIALNIEDGASEVAELVDRIRRGEITSRSELALDIIE